MRCQDVLRLLHPYSDGELDLLRQVEMEEHLGTCAACAEQEKNLRSLRDALSPSLSYRAPTALRARISNATLPAARSRRFAVRAAALAASVLVLLGASLATGLLVYRGDDRLIDRVVVAHIRSLQVEHLMDVASSDRHTVKPWFRGKLDFSPFVPDLSAQGFPLTGGRLDYLVDRPVAALVYSHRLHAINVYTWPAGNEEDKAVRRLSRQGFNIRHWQQSGMTYWAISDLNDQELDEFVRLIQENVARQGP